jgi:N-acetylmuramoyl-L-alanine amidase
MISIRQRPSPNFTERRGDAPIDMIVLHYTEMEDAEASMARLCDPAAQVSAHYLVDTDGTIWSLVAEEMRAWHAGVAFWAGETDINSRSIGIEIQNRGPGHGPDKGAGRTAQSFPRPQMDATSALCQDIMLRHAIPPSRVLGHSDVAVGRKVDPGPEFPWARLAAEGVGIWIDGAAWLEPDADRAIALLSEIGFALDDPKASLAAFRLHWVPEVALDAPLDPLSMGRLEDLGKRMAGS